MRQRSDIPQEGGQVMMTRGMCLNANVSGFVNVPCGTHYLGLNAYAMRCEDDALYTCQTAAKYGCMEKKKKKSLVPVVTAAACAHHIRVLARWYMLVSVRVLQNNVNN